MRPRLNGTPHWTHKPIPRGRSFKDYAFKGMPYRTCHPTGFHVDNLQKQMTLLDFLCEINHHLLLKKQFALKGGGTALNLFWVQLSRMSVDIDLSYLGSEDCETRVKIVKNLEKNGGGY